MSYKQSIYTLAIAALLLGTANSAAFALDINAQPTLGGSTVNANVGSSNSGTTADVNVNTGGGSSSGTDANVDAQVLDGLGHDTTANVNLNTGSDDNVNVKLGGSGPGSSEVDSVAADLDLLAGGPTGASGAVGGVATASLGLDNDLLGLSGNPGQTATDTSDTATGSVSAGGSSSGALIGRRALKSAGCFTAGGRQVLNTAAHTQYGPQSLKAWKRVGAVKVVMVRYCAELRRAVSKAIGRNGNIAAMQMAANNDRTVRSALQRSNASAQNILLAQQSGKQLTLYVY